MTYIKINNIEYPAAVNGKNPDRDWDNRHSKSITLTMTATDAKALFADDVAWSIVQRETAPSADENGAPVLDENGEPVLVEQATEFDNSEFSVAGDVIDHRDGTVTVKMGMPTDLELAYVELYGGVE